ncbi:hypothetical protein [Shewanella atlantica]
MINSQARVESADDSNKKELCQFDVSMKWHLFKGKAAREKVAEVQFASV